MPRECAWNELLYERFRRGGYGDVRPAYGSILVPLFEEDGLRMGELAERARLSKQTMTTLVRLMERNELRRELRKLKQSLRDGAVRTRTVTTVLPAAKQQVFTIFQGPGQSDELFESQYQALLREFENIEREFGGHALAG